MTMFSAVASFYKIRANIVKEKEVKMIRSSLLFVMRSKTKYFKAKLISCNNSDDDILLLKMPALLAKRALSYEI